MHLVLSAFPKTVPSNYQVQPVEVSLVLTPGETLDEEAWNKHERQCSPFYEWWDYKKRHEDVMVLLDHPEYSKRMHEEALVSHWNELLDELEPFDEYA